MPAGQRKERPKQNPRSLVLANRNWNPHQLSQIDNEFSRLPTGLAASETIRGRSIIEHNAYGSLVDPIGRPFAQYGFQAASGFQLLSIDSSLLVAEVTTNMVEMEVFDAVLVVVLKAAA